MVAVVNRGPDPETLRDELRCRGFQNFRRYHDLAPLMYDACRGELAAVIVDKLPHFATSTRDLLAKLEQLRKHEVRFISIHDRIDTETMTTTMGDIVTIVRAIVEFEHSIQRERIYEGLARARQQGKKLGRPFKDSDHPAFSETQNEITLQAVQRE
jgi:DNA invertase Pin-like site-specific DNA recombinase